MRYQVPQFVDIEDKIIGPFTLQQFIIYIVAVLVLIPVYLYSDISLFTTIAIPTFGLAALFAHFRLNGRTLFALIAHALAFFSRGQLFVWRRTSSPKFLKISGEEYGDFSGQSFVTPSSLDAQARALETAGRVVSEDAEDPLVSPDAAPPPLPTRVKNK